MTYTVAEVIVQLLVKLGVQQIFGLTGEALSPLSDAVRKSQIEWINVRTEEGAALAASGQAKITGRLAVCAGKGGSHGARFATGLYEAARDHASVLALSVRTSHRPKSTDGALALETDLLIRDVSLYTQTVSAAEEVPGATYRAAATAYAGAGVAHLILPQDILSAYGEPTMTNATTLGPRVELTPSDADITELEQRINVAKRVAVLCGIGCRGSAEQLRELSDRLKAPLFHTIRGKDIIPYADPCWMGGLGMIGTRPSFEAMQECDLLIMAGTDFPYQEFLPRHGNVVQIDNQVSVLGRRLPTSFTIVGSVRPTIDALLKRDIWKSDAGFFERVNRGRAEWDQLIDEQSDLMRSPHIIHPQAVARMVSDLATEDSVFVLDTGLNTLWSANWIRQKGIQRIIGSFNNGTVGTALAQANGVQSLDRSRQVIAMIGDGGFNMLMGEFLTSVHHRLPVKIVIFNNSTFGVVPSESDKLGSRPFREFISYPNPDYAAFARSCGAQGYTVRDPGRLQSTLEEAFECSGPAIVDCVVVADEKPNLPHIDLAPTSESALEALKTAITAVTGG